MSNFLYGRIVLNEVSRSKKIRIEQYLQGYPSNGMFALRLIETLPMIKTYDDINFIISDNHSVDYCEHFLEPLIYKDGEPLLDDLIENLKMLETLLLGLKNYNSVKKIEFRFSCPEAEEEEYSLLKTSVTDFKKNLLNQYLTTTDFPTLKIVVSLLLD